ncbi:MAG: peptidase M50 [Ruminococcaceae bacterium]|nr:peptidase M50 [Oscillospiraceae bacterium]
MVYILAAILIFGVLIAVHELGHFLAAKACGVPVHEFSIGMGPAIWQKETAETKYSLRVLPIGGFCAMEGEEEDSDNPKALNNQGFFQKLLIYAAGAVMNFLTGLLILIILFAGAKAFYTAEVTEIAEGSSLAQPGGMQVGDVILSIDGEKVYNRGNVTLLLGLNTDGTYDFVVRRNGEKVTIRDFAMERKEFPDSNGGTYVVFGFTMGGIEEVNFFGRLRYSWNSALDFVRTVRLSLEMLLTGQAGISDLSGPVGIVNTITEVGQQSESVKAAVENIAYLAALIAVNLAVMNLLPLPALDGGKIFFLVVNQLCLLLFRKQIPAKFENYIHVAGFILLMGLMAVVMFQDVWKLFQ